MRVCISSGLTLYDFVMKGMQTLDSVDLLILGFGSLPVLSYEAEIEGEETTFEEICTISKNLNCVLIAAADTDLYGIKHKSVAVIDRGKLINVSDMVNVRENGGYTAGSEYNVYRTSAGKIGLLIDNDIFFGEARLLKNTGCDFIVAAVDSVCTDSIKLTVMGEAKNMCDIVCVCRDSAFIAGTDSKLTQRETGVCAFLLNRERVTE